MPSPTTQPTPATSANSNASQANFGQYSQYLLNSNDAKRDAANVAIPNTYMMINGVKWVPLPQTTELAQIALSPIVEPDYESSTSHTEHNEEGTEHWHRTSINWNDFSHPVDVSNLPSSAYTLPIHNLPSDSPFLLDSGASCHISPIHVMTRFLASCSTHVAPPLLRFSSSCLVSLTHPSHVGLVSLISTSCTPRCGLASPCI